MVGRTGWLRLLGEAALIVGSILLAFAIDASWDAAQERSQEQESLTGLLDEFRLVDQGFESDGNRELAQYRAVALLGAIQGRAQVPFDSLNLWSTGLSFNIEFTPPRAVLDDQISSGRVRAIRSDSLRFALARYVSGLERLGFADAQAWATWEQRIQPLLEGKVPRVDRLRSAFVDLPFEPSSHPTRWDLVLADPRFEDVVAERWLRVTFGVEQYHQLGIVTSEIVRLIEQELEPR